MNRGDVGLGFPVSNKVNMVGSQSLVASFTGTLSSPNPYSGIFGTGNFKIFLASGTFNIPAGVTTVRSRVWSGAGNGYLGTSSSAPGPGGGGCGYSMKITTGLSPLGSIAVTVGGANSASSFGSYHSATGGQPSTNGVNGGLPGSGVGGDVNFTGGIGGAAVSSGGSGGGGGAANVFGNGADGGQSASGANVAQSGRSGFCGGGGGGAATANCAGYGGNGQFAIGGAPSVTNPNAQSAVNQLLTFFLDSIGCGAGGGGCGPTGNGGAGINGGGGGGGGSTAGCSGGSGGFPGGGGGGAFNGIVGPGSPGLVIVEW